MSDAVELTNVSKSFGRQVAVDDLSLRVLAGSIYGFIGPNGSGKTTTLRMIMRIILPDRGTVRVLDETAHQAASDLVAYLPEERGLYKQMTVRDTLRFYGRLKSHSPSDREIDDWLERLQLPGVASKKIETLSKGMSQKIQLIATIIARPKLLVLDEPFSGLDPVNAVVVRELILELRKSGTTILFSTHDMSVAEKMCDSIFMIYRGKKVLDGKLDAIRQTYGTDIVHVQLDSNGSAVDLSNLPGVQQVSDFGQSQELRVAPSTDRQALLAELMRRGRIVRFELAQPTLSDIFVRIAAPHEAETAHA